MEPYQKMPAPDALVQDDQGRICAAIFFYAPSEFSLAEIAAENGFETTGTTMERDLGEDHPLWLRYSEKEDGEAINDWHPKVPAGWTFGDKFDSEDGPVAIFLRPKRA